MALMTGKQYEESLRKLNLKVYLLGELVENTVDSPIIKPSMNSVALTYELAHKPDARQLNLQLKKLLKNFKTRNS